MFDFGLWTILKWILGIVGIGGLGFWGLAALGLGGPLVASIVAWFAAKKIPWKWVVMALGAFAITIIVFSVFEHYESLQKDLATTKEELRKEQLLSAAQKARAETFKTQHDAMVSRLITLEIERQNLAKETMRLSAMIDDLKTEEDMQNDQAKAMRDFNRVNVHLNRMLEARSRGTNSGADGAASGGQAGTPGAPQALR